MSQEVRELAYSPILWAVTITAISLVLILATFYLVKAVNVSKEMGITQKQLKDAAKTSAIASIGPTIVICVGMISLLVMIGAPTAWMRLSVIGDITQELMAVGFATDAYGLTATAESITPEILQIAVFLMAIACIGYHYRFLYFWQAKSRYLLKNWVLKVEPAQRELLPLRLYRLLRICRCTLSYCIKCWNCGDDSRIFGNAYTPVNTG